MFHEGDKSIVERMAMLLYMLECNYGFVFHRERRSIRATGDTVFVDGIILIFKSESCIQRNISFREMFVITKSVTGKKSFSVGIKSFESCTHEIAGKMLTSEEFYRSYRIINGEPYHK